MSFGINTNILETNIINLAVVIGFLVYVGGDVLTSTLETRKELILKSLKDAEEKFQKTELDLAKAKEELALASNKADEIRVQSKKTLVERNSFLVERASNDIKRLEESQEITIRLEEEKVLKQLCSQFSQLALSEAVLKVRKRLSKDLLLQRQIIDVNISLLSKL